MRSWELGAVAFVAVELCALLVWVVWGIAEDIINVWRTLRAIAPLLLLILWGLTPKRVRRGR